MGKIKTLFRLLKKDKKNLKRAIFLNFYRSGISRVLSDKVYLRMQYKAYMGKKLNFKNPQTYNEKLQWLKLYNRKDEYTEMVDKYLVKNYVANKIGEQYIIKTLGVWDNVKDINFDKLPNQFVLKCTHDSGSTVICKDKIKFDIKGTLKFLKNRQKKKMYLWGREWPYKNVKPRIIAEEYMVDESGYELKDYKFFCFDGKVRAMFIAKDRTKANEETKFDFFDENFNHLPFTNGHPNAKPPYYKPENFEKMKELAEELSIGIPHVRVDFYNINGKIYFGELTFFHWSGIIPFEPEEWDYKFGSWIKLPKRSKGAVLM